MSNALFRKVALERLSSPEQLDRVTTVTSPRVWLALLMLYLILGAVVIWSVFGTLPTRATAAGIIITAGGLVVDAVAPAAGTLSEVLVDVDDEVVAGQLIARLTQPDTAEQIRSAEGALNDARAQLQALEEAIAAEEEVTEGNIERRQERLQRQLEMATAQVETARRRLEDNQTLYEERIITRDIVESSQQSYNQALLSASDVRTSLDELEASFLERSNANDNRLRDARNQVATAERRLSELQANLASSGEVLAPASGRVIERKVGPGAVLTPGRSVVSIERGGEGLEALAFVPSTYGKQVQPGMVAQVDPETVQREESGMLQGTVTSISDFPITSDGIVAILQNPDLAQQFTRAGPPYVGRVELARDAGTASGYAWSSPRGAETQLTSGTLCTVEITVRHKAPITLVIPLLKQLFEV